MQTALCRIWTLAAASTSNDDNCNAMILLMSVEIIFASLRIPKKLTQVGLGPDPQEI